jgi:hypothetical protein
LNWRDAPGISSCWKIYPETKGDGTIRQKIAMDFTTGSVVAIDHGLLRLHVRAFLERRSICFNV